MKKPMIIWIVALVLSLAICAALIFFPGGGPKPAPTAPTAPTEAMNVPTTEKTEPTEAPTTTEIPETTVPPETEPDEWMLKAMDLVAEMDEHEKLCQLLVTTPEALTDAYPTTVAGNTTRRVLGEYPVAGFILAQDNIVSPNQIMEMTNGLRDIAETGMLICVDEEGGDVWRVMGNPNFSMNKTDSMYSYRNDGPEKAYDNARYIAEDLNGLGINTNLAPVADVWSNKSNTVIGSRAYSDDYAQAAELVAAAVEGFHEGGVICTLKHFPGHGDTKEDSHDRPAYVNLSAEEIRESLLLPFKSGIEAGADMVMIGHLNVPALDENLPATFSYPIVTELLRKELGFGGVVITDNLQMGAVKTWSDGEKAVLALQAGCDLLLGIEDVPAALEAMQKAIDDGSLTWERVDLSVARVLRMKLLYGIVGD